MLIDQFEMRAHRWYGQKRQFKFKQLDQQAKSCSVSALLCHQTTISIRILRMFGAKHAFAILIVKIPTGQVVIDGQKYQSKKLGTIIVQAQTIQKQITLSFSGVKQLNRHQFQMGELFEQADGVDTSLDSIYTHLRNKFSGTAYHGTKNNCFHVVQQIFLAYGNEQVAERIEIYMQQMIKQVKSDFSSKFSIGLMIIGFIVIVIFSKLRKPEGNV